MRIIALRTLREYWAEHANARQPLQVWYDHARLSEWNSPEDLIKDYGRDLLLLDQRAVFKIKGNQYRLVVRIKYIMHVVFIRFIGTHDEYDQIDATKI